MDPEFWASRVTAARRNASPYPDQYFCMDDAEGEDATRLDFLCPYCYQDFDIASLCCHVEEEHCHETIHVACPVCNTNIGMDIVGHITRQHSHLFKTQRRRKNVKGGVRSNLHPDASMATADPLLSSFICGLPSMETHEPQNTCATMEEGSAKESSDSQAIVSADSSVPDEESKQMLEEGMQRAEFVQQLMLSIILPEEF
ncbi:protein DEHYDRATION-INDUCED 19 [Cryptomeria japonica]|uniref:protein DEHYDRATION-INDUCED 19 n=1 Tax=Cryptomeria japonica TaxID=3369 RepID=UPI0027D9FF54|nr:protein DEHYDRATION-INDUCED 19 [Cryptomeria japonica]